MEAIKIGITKANTDAIKYLLNVSSSKTGPACLNKIIVEEGVLYITDGKTIHSISVFDAPNGVYGYEKTKNALYLNEEAVVYPKQICNYESTLNSIEEIEGTPGNHKILFCDICKTMYIDYELYDKSINKNDKIINTRVGKTCVEVSAVEASVVVLTGSFGSINYKSIVMGMVKK